MARRADQELNDQESSTSWNYTGVGMDQLKQHWPIILFVLVLLFLFWHYGLKK